MAIANVPLRDLPTGCGTCPDVILGLLTQDVYEMLEKVRRVKRIVTCINRLTHDAANLLIDELERILSIIPEPPFFNLQLLTGMLTCPLTPQALVIEQFDRSFSAAQRAASGVTYPSRAGVFLSTLSTEMISETSVLGALQRPRDALVRIIRIIEGFARQIRRLIETLFEDLSGVDNTGFVRLMYRLAEELRLTFRDADEYLVKLAVTSGSAALVRSTCPSVYARTDLPFLQYEQEMSSFSFDGILPSGFQGETRRMMELFAQIQLKLARWQSASFLVVA